jgi:hypothetical protein
VEKSDMKSRLAFLEGERKAMDNLKQDLVRRIKMLEYSLRQERLKKSDSDEQQQIVPQTPVLGPPRMTQEAGLMLRKGFGHNRSRELLKSYLKEADILLSTTQQNNTKKVIPSSTFYPTISSDLAKNSAQEPLELTVFAL